MITVIFRTEVKHYGDFDVDEFEGKWVDILKTVARRYGAEIKSQLVEIKKEVG